MRRLTIVATMAGLVLATALTGGAWAGGGGGALCSGFGAGSQIELRDSCFEATAHFVEAGSELAVVNTGGLTHDLTAVDGSLGTGDLAPGDETTVAVGDPGITRFYCTIHGTADGQGMAGVLVVGEPTPASAPLSGLTSDIQRLLADQQELLDSATDAGGLDTPLLLSAVRQVGDAVDELAASPPMQPAAATSGAPWWVVAVVLVCGVGLGVLGRRQRSALRRLISRRQASATEPAIDG